MILVKSNLVKTTIQKINVCHCLPIFLQLFPCDKKKLPYPLPSK